MTIRNQNFKALAEIVDIKAIQDFTFEAVKSKSGAYMDLNFDYLFGDDDKAVVALSHYYRVNGDPVADPDMEIEIDFENQSVRARTYQDTWTFNDVREIKTSAAEKVAMSLDRFLSTWLRNLKNQGHKIDETAIRNSTSAHRIVQDAEVDHA